MKRLWPALLLCAFGLRAQEEPTPFWAPPPPPKKKAPAPPPEKKKPKPVQVKPLQIERKNAPASKKPPHDAPTWIEATPHPIEPPKPVKVEAAPKPVHAPIQVELPSTAERKPATPIAPAAAPPALNSPLPSPVVTPQPAAAPVPPPILPPPAPVIAQPEPEPEPVAVETRNWTFDLLGGGWAKSRSDGGGRSWDLAYGLRAGYGFFDDQLELELQLARAGGTSGSPFVYTTATHDLAAARAFWVLSTSPSGEEGGSWLDPFALLLGGGGGVALAQTHYALIDVISNTPTGLDANAIKPVMEITAAGRARVFRGLQLRAEVSAMLRDGRIEFLPLFGLGWAL